MSMTELMHVSQGPQRFDVVTGAGRRRRFTAAQKAAIAAESYAGEDWVCGVARRHGPKSQQLFGWRRLARLGPFRSAEQTLFVPAIVAPSPRRSPSLSVRQARSRGDTGDEEGVEHRTRDERRRGSGRPRCRRGRDRRGDRRAQGQLVIGPVGAVRVMLATRPVDLRKGMNGLALLMRESLGSDPFSGTVFAFRAKKADRLKLLFFDGTGMVLVAKRLEAGDSRWPKPGDAVSRLTAAEMAALIDGLDWRRVHVPRETVTPVLAG